jgi:hypothetical protein
VSELVCALLSDTSNFVDSYGLSTFRLSLTGLVDMRLLEGSLAKVILLRGFPPGEVGVVIPDATGI